MYHCYGYALEDLLPFFPIPLCCAHFLQTYLGTQLKNDHHIQKPPCQTFKHELNTTRIQLKKYLNLIICRYNLIFRTHFTSFTHCYFFSVKFIWRINDLATYGLPWRMLPRKKKLSHCSCQYTERINKILRISPKKKKKKMNTFLTNTSIHCSI